MQRDGTYLNVNLRDASQMLDLPQSETRRMLESGVIQGSRASSTWSVEVESILSRLRENAPDSMSSAHTSASQSTPDGKVPLRVMSFFSGAMGLDQGLEAAGLRTVIACESDKASRETIRANRPDLPLIGNIWNYDAKTIRAIAGMSTNESPDVVAGGPPCQAFSTAGSRRGLEDQRGNVFMHFLHLITELRPKYAVIENVRGLLSMPLSLDSVHHGELSSLGSETEFSGKHGVIRLVTRVLERAGYFVAFNLYNAANYGSAQIRERVVLIASLSDGPVPYLSPTNSSDPSFGLESWRSLRDVVGGLPDDQHHAIFPESRLKYFRRLTEGQNWRSLPVELQQEAMGKSYFLGGGKTGFYRRLSWDKPAPTLVTHPAMPATDLCHPTLDRPLSVEEYRRIQDFPDGWKLCGNVVDQYRQLGNAVPVNLGKAIGNQIALHHSGTPVKQLERFPYSRYRGTDHDSVLAQDLVRTLF